MSNQNRYSKTPSIANDTATVLLSVALPSIRSKALRLLETVGYKNDITVLNLPSLLIAIS